MKLYENMDLDQLKIEMKKIQDADFMLQMKDHWSREDHELHQQHYDQIRHIEKRLKELEEKE